MRTEERGRPGPSLQHQKGKSLPYDEPRMPISTNSASILSARFAHE
jgi:hypothetical protein